MSVITTLRRLPSERQLGQASGRRLLHGYPVVVLKGTTIDHRRDPAKGATAERANMRRFAEGHFDARNNLGFLLFNGLGVD